MISLQNIAIHAWNYAPNFDHQVQANQAWKSFRVCRKKLETRIGSLPLSLRIGHSLGCKLHLLSPDGGRNSKALIALSFNNFTAKNSIPFLGKVSTKLNMNTEFSPSPNETMKLIFKYYEQPNNLLISFSNDNLDQSNHLLTCLQKRSQDKSGILKLDGNHLTPISTGLSDKLKDAFPNTQAKAKVIGEIVHAILKWL